MTGDYHQAPLYKRLLANLAFVLQFTLLGAVVAGQTFFQDLLKKPVPTFIEKLQERQILYATGIWIVFSSIQSMLTSTGAFEISIDGQLVYSKIETG